MGRFEGCRPEVPNGAQDTTFGPTGNGIFTLDVTQASASVRTASVLGDKLIVTGYSTYGGFQRPVIFKLTSAGLLDMTFGVFGAFTDTVGTAGEAYGAALQSVGTNAGKLVTVGYGRATTADQIYAWRFGGRCPVETALTNKVYAAANFGTSLINNRGLSAAEYLLFYPGTDNECPDYSAINSMGTWAAMGPTEIIARKRDYAAAIAADILANTECGGQRRLALWKRRNRRPIRTLSFGARRSRLEQCTACSKSHSRCATSRTAARCAGTSRACAFRRAHAEARTRNVRSTGSHPATRPPHPGRLRRARLRRSRSARRHLGFAQWSPQPSTHRSQC